MKLIPCTDTGEKVVIIISFDRMCVTVLYCSVTCFNSQVVYSEKLNCVHESTNKSHKFGI